MYNIQVINLEEHIKSSVESKKCTFDAGARNLTRLFYRIGKKEIANFDELSTRIYVRPGLETDQPSLEFHPLLEKPDFAIFITQELPISDIESSDLWLLYTLDEVEKTSNYMTCNDNELIATIVAISSEELFHGNVLETYGKANVPIGTIMEGHTY